SGENADLADDPSVRHDELVGLGADPPQEPTQDADREKRESQNPDRLRDPGSGGCSRGVERGGAEKDREEDQREGDTVEDPVVPAAQDNRFARREVFLGVAHPSSSVVQRGPCGPPNSVVQRGTSRSPEPPGPQG